MMTIPTCRAWRFCVTQFLVVTASALLCVPSVHADTILVGTRDGNDAFANAAGANVNVQGLVEAYNNDTDSPLPAILAKVDKLESSDSSLFKNDGTANLQTSDFTIYQQASGESTSLDIFDTSVDFASWDGTNLKDVMAFQQLSGPAYNYYAVKGGQHFSLWYTDTPGLLHPAYVDDITDNNSETVGSITDPDLAYKPLTGNGDKISHVTFYSAVPSPSSTVALVGLGAMGLLALLRRRRALSH